MKPFAGTDDMGELFAGSLTGYAMALVFAGASARLVVAARSHFTFLSRAIAPNLGAVMLAVPISILSFLIWTLVGILLGLIYRAARQAVPWEGLGSPNWPFTLGILVVGLLFPALVIYGWRSVRWEVVAITVGFVGLFGWALPHAAEAY